MTSQLVRLRIPFPTCTNLGETSATGRYSSAHMQKSPNRPPSRMMRRSFEKETNVKCEKVTPYSLKAMLILLAVVTSEYRMQQDPGVLEP